MTIQNKKTSILLVLKVLEEYSDEEHYLTHQDIIDKVKSIYGIELERKSVAYSLELLIDLGYDVNKNPHGGGWALLSRLFEPSEVRFITDALFSSKALPGKQAGALSRKAQSVLSEYQRRNYNYIHKTPQLTRTASKDVFYAIDMVHEGIKRGKRISFQYKTYDEHGNPCLRKQGYRYVVSPYYLVSNNGFYYLLCNYREKYQPIHIFRVDALTNIQIEEQWPLKPLSSVKGGEDFDIAEYMNEHIYMLGGNTIDATLRIDKPYAIQYLRDWFGDRARIIEKDGVLLAKIRCNENSLFYWILHYCDEFTLLEPQDKVEELRVYLGKYLEKYVCRKEG